MTKMYAFYLPQFHPTRENNEWWGDGFTEWTNVASAQPLFKGHKQPKLPGELGFYDLRLEESRVDQANLASEHGVSGFLYWHYWFGSGKRLLDRPFNEVLSTGNPNFPFALSWANHSWERKSWSPNVKNVLLINQEYNGESDYRDHFMEMLSAFRDDRYIKVDGKLLFVIFNPLDDEIKDFISCWRGLAVEFNLLGFHFVGRDFDSRNRDGIIGRGFDAIYNDDVFNIHHKLNFVRKLILKLRRDLFNKPTVFKYKDALKFMITESCQEEDVIPVIAPNWDHSPRSGRKSIILVDDSPKYFGQLIAKAIEVCRKKHVEKRIVFIKSWNEWGEGNFLEPDRVNKRGNLEILQSVLSELDK